MQFLLLGYEQKSCKKPTGFKLGTTAQRQTAIQFAPFKIADLISFLKDLDHFQVIQTRYSLCHALIPSVKNCFPTWRAKDQQQQIWVGITC